MNQISLVSRLGRSSTIVSMCNGGFRSAAIDLVVSLSLILLVCSSLTAKTIQDSPEFSDTDIEFFESKVRPLLVNNCYECHGNDPKELEGGLSVASRKSILTGGDSGPAIVPGDPEESLLIQAINYDDVYEMPPTSKMADADIQLLTEWVQRGAPWPANSDVEVAKAKPFDWRARKKEHWCWQPIVRPPVPAVKDAAWPLDKLDHFILAKLEEAALSPANQADKRSLIRRAYFDLVGLPPEPSAIAKFENDSSPEAFAKVVDRLLASPRFGERWARHWMDLVRYAETCGHEFDFPIHHAYQYRDYLIRAFNANVPFDQFMTEHIAGDLLEKPRRHPDKDYNESIIGTGFWFLHEATHAPVDVKGDEAGRIDNQIDVLCKTFMGLTVACARCHDHKFDAISTEDYYALSGFLQSSRRQLAMLDPDRKIEHTYQACATKASEANELLDKWMKQFNNADKKKAELNIAAALDWLRQDADWNKPGSHKIQGQSLKDRKATAGVVAVQRLKNQKKFSLEGKKQLWWRDAKPGDKLTVSFELPKRFSQPQTIVELFAKLTYAPDYGIAEISFGETELGEFDFFSSKLHNKRIRLGEVELRPGKQVLTVEITGAHADAEKRHMFGMDFLEVIPSAVVNNGPSIQQYATKKGLNGNAVQGWADLIKNPKLTDPQHELHFLRNASLMVNEIRHAAKFIPAQLAIQNNNSNKQKLPLFEDFDNLDTWYSRGFAFENYWQQTGRFSMAGSLVSKKGTAHSGRFGKKLQGVLQSPTFTLEYDRIHILCRGEKAQVRLVIDGFEMNTFNQLLFKGTIKDINSPVNFTWLTLDQDVANYRGHRAHLEFIDHGDGFCELDEIRFSNKRDTKPSVVPSTNLSSVYKFSARDTATVSQAFVKFYLDDNAPAEVLSLIFEHLSEEELGMAAIANADTVPVSAGARSGELTATRSSVRLDFLRKRDELLKLADAIPSPTYAVAMASGTDENEFLFIRGNHKKLGKLVPKRFVKAINEVAIFQTGLPETGTANGKSQDDRRLWLARQFSANSNPLPRRVIVNRIWHHLMGQGIVPSVDNLGVLGQKPTHPELLDHLAEQFRSDDWSIKKMIRRIVLSRTYQMSSELNLAAKDIDPDNNLLHRARIKRLQGEAIRDSMLRVAGRLDTKMFGPSVATHLTSFMQGRGRPKKSGPLDGERRRSVYLSVRRNFVSPLMLAFDTPTPFNTMGRRTSSNVPAQALILMNDPFVIQQAGNWAKHLVGTKKTQDDSKRSIKSLICSAYEQALGRLPTDIELQESVAFIEGRALELNLEAGAAMSNVELWSEFCHVLFNVKEFIYIK